MTDFDGYERKNKMPTKSRFNKSAPVVVLAFFTALAGLVSGPLSTAAQAEDSATGSPAAQATPDTKGQANSRSAISTVNTSPSKDQTPKTSNSKQTQPDVSTRESDHAFIQLIAKICKESRDKYPNDHIKAAREAEKSIRTLPRIKNIDIDGYYVNFILESPYDARGIGVHFPFRDYDPKEKWE